MDVVLDGFLLKSPPTKRFCKAKWRERWFVLRHSGHIPGQFVLEYYTDSTCRKLKGKIDLDQLDQIDSGLPYQNRKTHYQHMFNIHTPKRIYYLVAKTELEMNKWVDCICSVCGLKIRVEDEAVSPVEPTNPLVTTITAPPISIATPAQSTTNLTTTNSESSPYIPISECITGKPVSNGFQTVERGSRNNENTNSFLHKVPPPPPKTQESGGTVTSEFYDHPISNNPREFYDKPKSVEGIFYDHPKSIPPNEFYDHPKSIPPPPPPQSAKEFYDHPKSIPPAPPPQSVKDFYDHPKNVGVGLNDEFYDHPKPILSHAQNGRTSPEPNMDNMYKIPPTVSRHANEVATKEESSPLCPPKVNWRTYPENGGNTTYDIPNQTLKKDKFKSEAEIAESADENGLVPPRPPKPPNLGDKKKEAEIGATGGATAAPLYDTPPSSKGVFLSKHLPAEVFSFLKNDQELVDVFPSTKVPLNNQTSSVTMAEPISPKDVDEMYDFPRSRSDNHLGKKVPLPHQASHSSLRRPRQHAYSNAPPGLFGGKNNVMNYEYRPSLMNKESPVATDDMMLEANSPPPLYSPVMAAIETTYTNVGGSCEELNGMPPVINRGLKPKKKLSDPTEPGFGPFNLAPPPALQPGHSKCSFRKTRPVPSPVPSGSGLNSGIPSIPYRIGQHTDPSSSDDDSSNGSRRNSNNDDQAKHFLSPPAPKVKAEIQYLDLDLDSDGTAQSPRSPDRSSASCVYKTVDFVKTNALNVVKQNVNETYRKNQ